MISNPDSATLMTLCFIPGITQMFQVKNQENKSLAIYFVFSKPGEEWKYLVGEEKSQKIKILLGENAIKSVDKF